MGLANRVMATGNLEGPSNFATNDVGAPPDETPTETQDTSNETETQEGVTQEEQNVQQTEQQQDGSTETQDTSNETSASETEASTEQQKQDAADDIADKQQNVQKITDDIYEIEVNGEKHAITRDKVLALAQKGFFADKKMYQADQKEKQIQAALKTMNSDPKKAAAILKEMGVDAKKFAETLIVDELKLEQMTPEQRRTAELEAKLQQMEEERRASEQTAHEKHINELASQMEQQLDTEIGEALQKTTLPKTAEVVAEVAQKMLYYNELGYTLNAESAVKLVEEEFSVRAHSLLDGMSDEMLVKFLGDNVMSRMRKVDVARFKQNEKTKQQPKQHAPRIPKQEEPKEKPFMDRNEWRKKNRERLGM